jgi:hypothetical protein
VAIVKTMQNPDDRAKAIKLAKEQRAREDRLHLENGNLKKERDNVSNLLKNLETNPVETIKHLAKELNLDLTSLNEPVYDDNDYLSPEELSKKQIQDIQKKSKQSTIGLYEGLAEAIPTFALTGTPLPLSSFKLLIR